MVDSQTGVSGCRRAVRSRLAAFQIITGPLEHPLHGAFGAADAALISWTECPCRRRMATSRSRGVRRGIRFSRVSASSAASRGVGSRAMASQLMPARELGLRLVFASHVARLSVKELGLARALPQRHDHQQAPQAVPVVQVDLAVAVPDEEAAEDRLQHVLGSDLGLQGLIQTCAGPGQ